MTHDPQDEGGISYLAGVLEQAALFRHLYRLRNDAPDGRPLAVTLAARSTGGEPLTEALTGEPFTLEARNEGEPPAFISIWELRSNGAMTQVHPANTDCDLLYGGRTLTLSVTCDAAGGSGALYKLIATAEPHELRMFQQPASPYVTGDLIEWLDDSSTRLYR